MTCNSQNVNLKDPGVCWTVSTPHATVAHGTGVQRLKNFQMKYFLLHSSVILMMNAKNLLDNGKWKQNKMFENKRIPNLKTK